jgi:hypothetical protein
MSNRYALFCGASEVSHIRWDRASVIDSAGDLSASMGDVADDVPGSDGAGWFDGTSVYVYFEIPDKVERVHTSGGLPFMMVRDAGSWLDVYALPLLHLAVVPGGRRDYLSVRRAAFAVASVGIGPAGEDSADFYARSVGALS